MSPNWMPSTMENQVNHISTNQNEYLWIFLSLQFWTVLIETICQKRSAKLDASGNSDFQPLIRVDSIATVIRITKQ